MLWRRREWIKVDWLLFHHFLLLSPSLFPPCFYKYQGWDMGRGKGGEKNEGYKSCWWMWGETRPLLYRTNFGLLNIWLIHMFGLKKSGRKKQILFVPRLSTSFFLSFLIPSSLSHHYWFLDTLVSLPSGCWSLGPSCCCFYSQDWSMNPGAFSSSGPLSWAMYLMRKGRTGSGLFGKTNSSLATLRHHHHLVISC